MRETLICTGRLGEHPYRFPETGTEVYSYEEICYYLSQHMICYLQTLPDEELLLFMKEELGLEKLAKVLSRLNNPERDQMKYFAALFREGNYFHEEEIRQILDEYRSLKNSPVHKKYKMLGDLMMESHRASAAMECYERALACKDINDKETGEICHNMGAAKMRLFRFQDAGLYFLKAYQRLEDERSLFYYYASVFLKEGKHRAEEEIRNLQVSDLLLESFQGKIDSFLEEFRHSDQSAACQRLRFMEENDRTENAKTKRQKQVRSMQKHFRSELIRL